MVFLPLPLKQSPWYHVLLIVAALNVHSRIGDSRHVMTYTIGAGKAFNMVLSHPEMTDPGTWKPETALEDMKAEFQGWDPM